MKKHEEIKAFLQTMTTQDRRGTADPFFYVIRTEVEHMSPIENADIIRFIDPDNCECVYGSREECRKELMEDVCNDKDWVDNVVERLEEYGVSKYWEERSMFLTEADAEKHLKLNHYHYSKNAHTYVKHAWRAPELKNFFGNLFEYFEVDKEWG